MMHEHTTVKALRMQVLLRGIIDIVSCIASYLLNSQLKLSLTKEEG